MHHPAVIEVLQDGGLVVDLGYGANPGTTLELAARLGARHRGIEVVGLEIDPARVVDPVGDVRFALGGFELAGLTPKLVRAFNVLRQYDETQVAPAWALVCSRLAPGGLFLEGTCDELGRRCAWVLLDVDGPRTLTLAWDPADVTRPSELAARLPKALIHRNVSGEPVHTLLAAADRAWDEVAPMAVYGPRVRWRAARERLATSGVPVLDGMHRVRDNLLTVPWAQVAPLTPDRRSGSTGSRGDHRRFPIGCGG